jgi:exopolyphosphatase/guanosine-5'-triphosphate,3'-diphosphate pyrophosphatase
VQTRLGQGLYAAHRLQPEAIGRTVAVVKTFAAEALSLGCESIEIVATSAARDATNRADLAEAILAATGRPLRIVTGNEEAELGFAGVTTDTRFRGCPLLLVDVGGGSTECVVGTESGIMFRHSCDLGVVRCLEHWSISDPPTPDERDACRIAVREVVNQEVAPGLEPALDRVSKSALRCAGIGGSATVLGAIELGLGAFDRERLDAVCLTRPQVEARWLSLWSVPLDQRRRIPGLPPERADVILAGVAIFAVLLERFDLAMLAVTTRGLRHALARGRECASSISRSPDIPARFGVESGHRADKNGRAPT